MADNRLVDDKAVQNGVHALGMAKDGVERIRGNVRSLALGVGGDEGRAFMNLFEKWDEQAQRIIGQINRMTDALEDNRSSAQKTSAHHQSNIGQQAGKVSSGVFEALT
ncbi:WXG100 family type VII secretion target [Streptomyces sp. cg35]|uniref:WXG100 family type VII secretion target n=1 Tax=Streptomyces sp. cg35 TaxID=3421650 RepID=UPI003D16DCF3